MTERCCTGGPAAASSAASCPRPSSTNTPGLDRGRATDSSPTSSASPGPTSSPRRPSTSAATRGSRDSGLRHRGQGRRRQRRRARRHRQGRAVPDHLRDQPGAAGGTRRAWSRPTSSSAARSPRLSAYFTTGWQSAGTPRVAAASGTRLARPVRRTADADPAHRGAPWRGAVGGHRQDGPGPQASNARSRPWSEKLRTEPQLNRKVELRRQLRARTG